jgi:hypothetical protein
MSTKKVSIDGRYVILHSKKDRSIPEYFLAGKELQEYLNQKDWSYYWEKEFDDNGMIINEEEDIDKIINEWKKITERVAEFFNLSPFDTQVEGYCDSDGDYQITDIILHNSSSQ